MNQAKKPDYEIHFMQMDYLINELENWESKSPKARLEIIRVLEVSIKTLDQVKLPWSLVEAFVDDVCQDPEHIKVCRDNIRALFENLEKPDYS